MNDKDRLKQSIKVSAVISAEWWEITKQAKNQYIMRCINPAHRDEKPSMAINDEKWIFKCFSCEIWWDIFNVLDYMRPDIKWFYKQLKYLEKNDYRKPIYVPSSLQGTEKKIANYQDDKGVQEVMNYIADYWSSQLPKKVKDDYLLNTKTISYRGYKWALTRDKWYWLSEDIIKDYKLWYAKYNSDLYQELLTKFDKKDIDKTGLFDKRWVSLFKERITIPTIVNWNVKYFTARKTELSPKNRFEDAKYKNQKWDNKYYYNEDDLHSSCLFIVEWYFDCLALKDIWYNSIALWWLYARNKKKLLEWITNSLIYIVFDNEENQAWNEKAIKLQKFLKDNWVDSSIVTLPLEENKKKIDVNEYLWTHSKEEFNKLILPY